MTDEEVLAAHRTRWIDAVNAGSVAGHAALLAEDVLWLRPGQLALRGRQEVLDWLTPFFDRFDYDFSISDEALRITGGWAVERAVFNSRLRPKEAERWEDHTGVYLMTWRREGGDNWFVHQYVDVSGMLSI